MFIAPREAKCSRPRCSRAGHEVFSQRQMASPSGRCNALPHRGQSVGMVHGRASAGRRLSTGPTTRGITSPAFSTITQSPSRMSLRAMSSSLCRVAIEMVEPATNTGSSMANGVTAPVRPDVDRDAREARRLLFRRVLEGDGPARELAGGAQGAPALDAVDLDDHAVGFEVEGAAGLGPLAAEGDHVVDGRRTGASATRRADPRRAAAPAWRACVAGASSVTS